MKDFKQLILSFLGRGKPKTFPEIRAYTKSKGKKLTSRDDPRWNRLLDEGEITAVFTRDFKLTFRRATAKEKVKWRRSSLFQAMRLSRQHRREAARKNVKQKAVRGRAKRKKA
jgi:hypothetical protein